MTEPAPVPATLSTLHGMRIDVDLVVAHLVARAAVRLRDSQRAYTEKRLNDYAAARVEWEACRALAMRIGHAI